MVYLLYLKNNILIQKETTGKVFMIESKFLSIFEFLSIFIGYEFTKKNNNLLFPQESFKDYL